MRKKIKCYRYLIISITLCTILLGVTFYLRINLEDQDILPTKIEAISPIEFEINKEVPINSTNVLDVKVKNTEPIKIENINNNLQNLPKEEKNGK